MADLPPPPGPPPGSYGRPPGPPPGPPPAPPTGYGPGAGATRANGFAIASLVLGVVGVVLCFVVVLEILAVIFGAVALSQIKQRPMVYAGRGMAIAGLVLGVVGLGLFVLVLLFADADYNLG